MNIAFSTIVIFLFLFPGIIYRRFYFSEEFSKQYFTQNFFELFVSSILPSILLHVLMILLIGLFGYEVDYNVLGQLISSKNIPDESLLNIKNNIGNIGSYQILIFTFSAVLGYLTKKIIRKNNFDSKYKLLRFKNSWHYILSGEFFEFPRAAYDLMDDNVNDIVLVYIDAMVETKEGTIIYDGVLVDYELSKEGGLSTISIKEAQRRFVKDDLKSKENNSDHYYDIQGHLLVIPYSKILNLNLSYYKLQLEDEDGVIKSTISLVK